MTYDWNKQVEITVPTGTNGWIYSGEVIINGVKVRFPVGVPTTVPEPAAALLNKMIELEREDENNTAKPDNHYVGSVTIPEGKTLTLAKGAKVVDEDGLLGSTPAPVVILPETELTVIEEDQQAVITTPWAVTPVAGNVYTINFNGVAYDCEAFAVTMEGPPAGTVMLGNAECLANFGITGGNPDAPFYGMLTPTPMGDHYGALYVMDASLTSVTLSIVEAAKTESAGGGGMFIVTIPDFTIGEETCTFDKTFAETLAAYKAGQNVVFRISTESAEITLPVAWAQHTGGNVSVLMGQTIAESALISIGMFEDGTGEVMMQPLAFATD